VDKSKIISFICVIIIGLVMSLTYYKSKTYEYYDIKGSKSIYYVKDKIQLGKTKYYLFESVENKYPNRFISKMFFNNKLTLNDSLVFNYLGENNFLKTKQLNTFYFKYWRKRSTYHELIKTPHYKHKKYHNKFSVISASGLRNNIWKWTKSHFSPNNAGLAHALLTGNKTHLNKGIKENMKTSGIYHILAVSGLHIGIIFFISHSLFSMILRDKNNSNYVYFLSILIVWYFTYITGMSPSSIRAASMTSLISAGKIYLKESFCFKNITHLYWIVMIVNICMRPDDIHDLGFQFSYLAYGGILIFYRLFNKVDLKNRVLRKAWAIISISLSAQIMVLPLSILYFKEIPSYFLIGNLISSPFLPLFYISCLLGAVSTPVSDLPILLTDYLLSYFQYAIEIIAQFKGAVISWKQFNISCCTLLYLLIISWLTHLKKAKKHYSIIAILLTSFLPISIYIKSDIPKNITELKYIKLDNMPVLMNINTDKKKNELHLYSCDRLKVNNRYTSIKDIPSDIIPHCNKSIQEISSGHNVILILNAFALKSLSEISEPDKVTEVVCFNSPFIDFKIINKLKSLNKFYYDNSNRHSYINYWKKRCKKEGITYYKLQTEFRLNR
jgi:competence protein ComEC